MKTPSFGKVQMRILKILWEKGRANAREITESLSRVEPIAHSTVQTLLRKLEEKNAIGHETGDRTFVFFPLIEERKVTQTFTKDLIERLFGGSPGGLVAYLLRNESIPADELKAIHKLIKEKEK